MDIGERIKSIREAKGLSQKQVSLNINMDPSQYSKIEKGKTDPSVSTLEKITIALGINLSELFNTNEDIQDINSADKTLIEKVQLIEQLDQEERNSVFKIIDGLFIKKKLRDTLTNAVNIAS